MVGRFQIKSMRKVNTLLLGRLGMDSMAARIAKDIDPSTNIDDKQPYGEVYTVLLFIIRKHWLIDLLQIWLGSTHANGPSKLMTSNVVTNGTGLRDLVASDPEYYLGHDLLQNKNMQSMYKDDMPFLFKILSFDKALPLQAHPDPSLGEKLRKQEKRKYAGVYNSDCMLGSTIFRPDQYANKVTYSCG